MSGNTSTDIWIAGAFAAFTVDLLVYPLDTLKTRIQSPDYRRLYTHEASNTVRKGVLFRGLYQGVGSVILATLPSSGAFFTTYESSKTLYSSLLPTPSPTTPNHTYNKYHASLLIPLTHSLASATAELISCAILTPAEVIKQNAQMVSAASIARTSTSATLQTLRTFRRNPLALWRGYGALAGRNLPFTALQFPLFERVRGMIWEWRRRRKVDAGGGGGGDGAGGNRVGEVGGTEDGKGGGREEEVGILEHAAITAGAAGSAGALAAVVTTPVDVVKTRIMLAAATSFADQGSSQSSSQSHSKDALDSLKKGQFADALGGVAQGEKPAYKKMSSLTIAKEIVAEHGWRGLWRGGALRGIWTMLGSGLYLGVYEGGKVWLARGREGGGED